MNKIGIVFAMSIAMMAPAHAKKQVAPAMFQQIVEEVVAQNAGIPGVVMAVSSPALGIEWSGAAGLLKHGEPTPLRVTDAFRVASVTKVYTAATVLRLMEGGHFSLFQPIKNLVPPKIGAILESGGYDLDAITIHQLLTHTSGIGNFAETDEYFDQVFSNLNRVWTPEEQVQFAVTFAKPIGKPGEKYEYSDTGYVVLGQIIEHVSGEPLHKAVADQLAFKKWRLNSTYFEKFQTPPTDERRAHQYRGEMDITDADPSMDLYGGGGIVSTVGDLVKFVRPLLTGKMFEKDTTLTAGLVGQLPVTGEDPPPLLYRGKFGKRTCLDHGGFWGVQLIYCPDIDLALALSMGQVDSKRDPIVARVAEIVEGIEAGTVGVK
ncbi:hypothetical protein ASD00_31370 [Ensifer sp. Root31]|uniref:serine hydrolase domain-containing protein n=1 Tax=Ensifer sp. Root31 TaxID=1736512 RepID=UPI00070C4375|nr:serine hydrolase domain-containing protein [Ensifer sp. Root31]KQU86390.1 hypothetical protein ASD00_31370 [Ensifer sp. Root31]